MSIPVIRYCFPFMLIVVYRQGFQILSRKGDFQNIWRILGTIGGKVYDPIAKVRIFYRSFLRVWWSFTLGLMKAGWRGVFAIEQSP